jgi:hypothetical protein
MKVGPMQREIGKPVELTRLGTEIEEAPALPRVPEPSRYSTRVAFGLSCTPAPISLSACACSSTVTSNPFFNSASAAVNPPIPAPAMMIFIRLSDLLFS